MTPERKAELVARFKAIAAETKPKPSPPPIRTVAEGGAIVRDADVHVSAADPNYPRSRRGVVTVRADLVGAVDADGRPIWPEHEPVLTAYNPFDRQRMGRSDDRQD